MPIAVQLGCDCRIAIQTKKTARCCGVIGPLPVKIVRSNRNARPGQSGGFTRWEHEHLLEAVQQRLDSNPQAMRQRRETVEHPFGTMKGRQGGAHFLTQTLPKVAAEMAL